MLTKTYTLELLRIIAINCPGSIEVVRSNYTAKGVKAEIRTSFDGKIYTLTIERAEI